MAGRKPATSAQRFAEKCKAGKSGCIEWTAGTTKNGYGLFYANGQMRSAHRWAFEQVHGRQPSDIDVCHTCDHRKCVNVTHLFAGTRQENMDDAVRKGRTSHLARTKGESHPMAVLSEADVLQIREWNAAGWSMRSLSDTYGVTFAQVSRIVNKQSWKHL